MWPLTGPHAANYSNSKEMKRILYVLVAAAALLAVSCNNELAQFSVTPMELNFSGEAGTQTVSVTADDTWALKI